MIPFCCIYTKKPSWKFFPEYKSFFSQTWMQMNRQNLTRWRIQTPGIWIIIPKDSLFFEKLMVCLGKIFFTYPFAIYFGRWKTRINRHFFLKKEYTTTLYIRHPIRKCQKKKWTGVNDSDILLQTVNTGNELIMKISRIDHRDEKRIRVDFPYNEEITAKLKLNDDVRWIKK